MRLPVRLASLLCLSVVAAGVRPARAQELSGGRPTQPSQQITRVEATVAPHTTEAAPQPLGFESEVSCFGFLGSSNERFIASIIGAQERADQDDYTQFNLVYLDAGADRGIKPGDEFWIVTPGDTVIHPYSGREMGRFYEYRGRGKVLCVEARTATVQITHACSEIPMGSFLKAYDPVPIPLGRKTPQAVACDPPSGNAKGRIVYARDGVYQVSADTDVLLDVGMAEGLEPGDFLTIFRYASGFDYGIRPVGSYWVNVPPPVGVEIPRTYLGEMAILYVGDRWAVARVNESTRLIEIGDQVELK
jgi:hypothetical protein